MITIYRVLAYVICALVMVQAAVHAWASAGLSAYIFGGGTIDPTGSAPPPVPEFAGIIIHGINGQYIIPVVAVLMLIFAFLAKTPHAVPFAGTVLGLVVLQVLLGLFSHGVTFLALLHGLNALALFAVALIAARTVGRVTSERGTAASVRG